MKNNKIGLYALYYKKDGSLVGTKVWHRSDAYKSNKDSNTYFNELLTESQDEIYNYPTDSIPEKSKNWSTDDILESVGYECDICGNFYLENEMAYIEDWDEGIHTSCCTHCDNN